MTESRRDVGSNLVQGRILEFDEHSGLGRVRSSSGDEFVFHCVEIADGSRRVAIGAEVEFEVRLKFSRPEAFSLREVAPGGAQP